MNPPDPVEDAETRFWRMRHSQLLDCLSNDALKQFVELCEIETIRRGRKVYDVGEPGHRVYVIESGSIKLSRVADDGREINLCVLGPMEIFGETVMSGEIARTDCAAALGKAVLCSIEHKGFERFLVGQPQFALRITKMIGDRLHRVEARIHDILFKDVRTRLAHTVARLADRFGEDTPGGMRIALRLTQTDLAQLIGSTRETTSTIFNEFRRDGFVDSDGRYIIVHDLDSLSTY